MTRFLNTFHAMLGTADHIASLLDKLIKETGILHINDLCSGSCGPMQDVYNLLVDKYGHKELSISYHDLYPDVITADKINNDGNSKTEYNNKPTDVLSTTDMTEGIRTMICSFHHFPVHKTKVILETVVSTQQPIFVFEISDNSFPKWIWWISIPMTFIMTLFITPFIRPMSWQQIVFTYLIPIIPLCIAWDGAVSNARTYTLNDLHRLFSSLNISDYKWEKGIVKDKIKMLYFHGQLKN